MHPLASLAGDIAGAVIDGSLPHATNHAAINPIINPQHLQRRAPGNDGGVWKPRTGAQYIYDSSCGIAQQDLLDFLLPLLENKNNHKTSAEAVTSHLQFLRTSKLIPSNLRMVLPKDYDHLLAALNVLGCEIPGHWQYPGCACGHVYRHVRCVTGQTMCYMRLKMHTMFAGINGATVPMGVRFVGNTYNHSTSSITRSPSGSAAC
jgi:hypothetical protein